MSINKIANRRRARESSDLKDILKVLKKEEELEVGESRIEKSTEQLSSNLESNLTTNLQSNSSSRASVEHIVRTDNATNITNSRQHNLISIALTCLNIIIFILLFSVLLLVLKFAFTRIRSFLSEHVN